VLPWPEDDWPLDPAPEPPPEEICEVAADAAIDGGGATGGAGGAFFGNSDMAAVNGACIAVAIELETACKVAATKSCFCAANAVVLVEAASVGTG